MGEAVSSEGQPEPRRSTEEQSTNLGEIFDFLEQQDKRHASAAPLDRVSPDLQARIAADFHEYDQLNHETSEDIKELADKLKGQALHQVRLLAEEQGVLSDILAKAAEEFKADDIDGHTFSAILQDVMKKQKMINSKLSIY